MRSEVSGSRPSDLKLCQSFDSSDKKKSNKQQRLKQSISTLCVMSKNLKGKSAVILYFSYC